MWRKADTRDAFRNPYVRPVLLAGCVLLVLWGVSETDFAQRELYRHFHFGRPLFQNSDGFELSLPGITYAQDSGYIGQTWSFEVRRNIVTFVLACGTVALFLRRVRRIRRARRHPYGCAACGYDLRASRDRCPECGEPIPGSAATVAP